MDSKGVNQGSFVSEMNDLSTDELINRLDELGSDLSVNSNESYNHAEMEDYYLGDEAVTPPKPIKKYVHGESVKELIVWKNCKIDVNFNTAMTKIKYLILGPGFNVVDFAKRAVELHLVPDEEDDVGFYGRSDSSVSDNSMDSTKSLNLTDVGTTIQNTVDVNQDDSKCVSKVIHDVNQVQSSQVVADPMLKEETSAVDIALAKEETPNAGQVSNEVNLEQDKSHKSTDCYVQMAEATVDQILAEATAILAAKEAPGKVEDPKDDVLNDFLLIESALVEQMRGLLLQLKRDDQESESCDKSRILEQVSALVEKLPNKDSWQHCLDLRREQARTNKCPYTEADIADLQLLYNQAVPQVK